MLRRSVTTVAFSPSTAAGTISPIQPITPVTETAAAVERLVSRDLDRAAAGLRV